MAGVKHKDKTSAQDVGTFKLNNGCEIYYGKYEPKSSPLACVLIIHSFGEHAGVYEHVAKRFVKEGFRAFSYDHRGFGRSGGKKGQLDSIESYIHDMGQVIKLGKINETNDGVRIPLYMYGHSSGGLGAILYHQFRLSYDLVPVDGIVATAPYLRLTKDLPEWQKGMINILNKIDSSYMVTASFDVQHLTSDVKFQEKYKSDPLRNSDISAKQLKIWSDAGAIAMYDTAKFTCPILIIHGDKDTVTDYRSSECFIQTCNSKDKKFILAKGFLHDLHTETGRVHIFRKVMQWINARVGSPKVTLTVNSNAGERRRSRAVIDRPPVLNEIIDKVKKEESQTFNDHHVNSVQLETRVTPEVSINIPERSTTFLVETD